jgi:lipid-binding SYLF domain-containing protein
MTVSLLGVSVPACAKGGTQPKAPPTSSPASTDSNELPASAAPDAGMDVADRAAAHATVARFEAEDPGIQPFFETCYGYVVFPTVGKGGFWVGGARGKGLVYERGALVGTATMTQLTAGAQIGGQSYSQILFFEDARAMRRFKAGSIELGAQVSAVAIERGVAATATYDDGLVVFTLAAKGLMAEATVAGQRFVFRPATST